MHGGRKGSSPPPVPMGWREHQDRVNVEAGRSCHLDRGALVMSLPSQFLPPFNPRLDLEEHDLPCSVEANVTGAASRPWIRVGTRRLDGPPPTRGGGQAA